MGLKSTIFFFFVSYILGWTTYIIPTENILYLVMGIFVLINIFTIFHPVVFHNGIMRPFQLSISSVGLLSLFTGNLPLFVFSLCFFIVLILVENENIDEMIEDNAKSFRTVFKRIVATLFLPFSVTYVVMIFRPYEEIYVLLVVLSYFTTLYFLTRWFDSIVLFSVFMIFQLFIFVWLNENYYGMNSLEITIFFISVFIFLLIAYGRKGLLSYYKNNMK